MYIAGLIHLAITINDDDPTPPYTIDSHNAITTRANSPLRPLATCVARISNKYISI